MVAPGVTVTGALVPPGVRLITGEVPPGVTVGDRAPLAPLSFNWGIPGIVGAPGAGASTLGFGGPSTSMVGSLAAIHSRRDSLCGMKALSALTPANLAGRPS